MDITAIKEEPDSDIEHLAYFDHTQIKKENVGQVIYG